MSQTRLFISSTCYDLIHIRQALNTSIVRLGHAPIMSEFSTFRVDPQLSPVENCRNNVRSNADIFVLIIGGRRGSVDELAGKSIVNLEYEAAVQEGLDIYVFVDQAVLNLVPIWSKNRDIDLTPTVDSGEVMAFVDHIRAEQRWTFPFTKEADIIDILSFQMSSQLRELLAKKRSGHFDGLELLAKESKEARYLVATRHPFWEYLLTAELLDTRLNRRSRELSEVRAGRILGSHQKLRGRLYMEWVGNKFPEITGALAKVKATLEEDIVASWGAPGVSGEPDEILRAADEMDRALVALIALESDVFRTHCPEPMLAIRESLLGISDDVFNPLLVIPKMLRDAVEQARSHRDEDGPLRLNLNIKFDFSRTQQFNAALEKMQMLARPEDW